MACAPSEDSDQHGHPCSLIRLFAVCMKKAGSLATHWAHSKDSDQTGWMPRLIWVHWAHSHFVGFIMRQLKFYFPVPPASVQITADPPVGREGQKLRLTCISASSNPAAVLTWIHNNKQLQVRYTVKKSLLSLSVFVVKGWRKLDHVKWIWHLSPVRAAKVQARLPIRAVSPEPPLLAHTSSE